MWFDLYRTMAVTAQRVSATVDLLRATLRPAGATTALVTQRVGTVNCAHRSSLAMHCGKHVDVCKY